ncbi:MAG: hypothetical protein HYV02_05850 [Deltaproteobacteria bacterium]|nr:hypothetical protein [Deltaproteobacteria bacterium]
MRLVERKHWQWVGHVVLACSVALISACGDGAGGDIEKPAEPAVAAPVIESFEAMSLADPTLAGDDLLIGSGEGILLTWSVSGAKSIILASDGLSFGAGDEVDASGSREIASLTASETFTLTANNQGTIVEQKVIITVAAPKPAAAVISFTGTPQTVALGEETQLCFEVVPSDATVEIIESETGTTVELAQSGPAAPEEVETEDGTNVGNPDATGGVAPDETGDEEPTVDDGATGAGDAGDATSGEEDAIANGALGAMAKLSLAATLDESAADAETPPLKDVSPGDLVTPETPGEPIVDETTVTDEPDDAEILPPSPSESYVGCSVPLTLGAGEHGFTLTVKSPDGTKQTAETTISVTAPIAVKSFTVNGSKEVTVESGAPLAFAWAVEPPDATITIEPDFGDVTQNTNAQGEGTINTKAEKAAVYTLTATHPLTGETATETVTVNIEVKKPEVVELNVTTSAREVFAGESVTFTVAETVEGTVTLQAPDGTTQEITDGSVTIPVTVAGGYSVVATDADGATIGFTKTPPTVNVQTWGVGKGSGKSWSTVDMHPSSDVVLAGAPDAIIGVHGGGEDWSVNPLAGDPAGSGEPVGFAQLFEYASNSGKQGALASVAGKYGPYPIHAFAFDPNKNEGQRVYAAMGGGFMASKDGGANWIAIDHILIWDTKGEYRDKEYVFTSCDGLEVKGINSSETDIIGIGHVCDVVVDPSSSRVIVATDNGVAYLDDPDKTIETMSKTGDQATRKIGWKGAKKGEGNLYGGIVVHALTIAGSSVYAGTDTGVYVNAQGGQEGAWSEDSGGELGQSAIYALAADNDDGIVYAGTATGEIATRSTSEGSWTTKYTVDAPVYDLAVDAETKVVIAGTGAGVFISRDGGETWSDVSASIKADEAPVVHGVAVRGGTFAAGTAQGVFISQAQALLPAPEVVIEEETPAETEPTPPEDGGTVTPPETPETPTVEGGAATGSGAAVLGTKIL